MRVLQIEIKTEIIIRIYYINEYNETIVETILNK